LGPYNQGELVSQLFEMAYVEEHEHTRDGVMMTVQLPSSLHDRFREYQVSG
jgi:hypothetical protein